MNSATVDSSHDCLRCHDAALGGQRRRQPRRSMDGDARGPTTVDDDHLSCARRLCWPFLRNRCFPAASSSDAGCVTSCAMHFRFEAVYKPSGGTWPRCCGPSLCAMASEIYLRAAIMGALVLSCSSANAATDTNLYDVLRLIYTMCGESFICFLMQRFYAVRVWRCEAHTYSGGGSL